MPLKDLEKRAAWRKQYYEDHGRKKNVEYRKENKEYIAEMSKIWRGKNKDIVQMRNKQYKDDHKEQISEQNKVKVTCGCGSIYCRAGKSRHENTRTHVIYIIEKMHDENLLVQERTNNILGEWGKLLRCQ